jgi:hypothetical protein
MKRALAYLLAPVALMIAGVVSMTVFDWDFGGWLALIGFIAFAAVAWWASPISDAP